VTKRVFDAESCAVHRKINNEIKEMKRSQKTKRDRIKLNPEDHKRDHWEKAVDRGIDFPGRRKPR